MSNVSPIPTDYPTVTPGLVCAGANAAIEFYVKILGASVRMKMPGPNDTVMHAEIQIGKSVVMVSDPMPEMGYGASTSPEGVSLYTYVADVDKVFTEAILAGATPLRPVEDQFYGDRTGAFTDPWNHRWTVASHVEDVSDAEMKKRMAEFEG
ncbi:VOC family protein [Nocardia camponoti]|uniref:Glyoxalase n=1 Tax=Nocardia camponoti TaxID=1616106 RepID=A0A917QSR0_9NOCA|nr:VOC family protein [Nocardia camponoti]GGK65739.1 glyoxalase [Nocardia camponoti]